MLDKSYTVTNDPDKCCEKCWNKRESTNGLFCIKNNINRCKIDPKLLEENKINPNGQCNSFFSWNFNKIILTKDFISCFYINKPIADYFKE
jgi:hypothetical protein